MRLTALIAMAAAGLALSACGGNPSAPRPSADEATRVTLSQGEVIGFVTEQGAHSWRAIPYAAPPVGDMRWRAPRPVAAFEGVYEALDFGPRCVQMTNALDEAEGLEPGQLVGAEDCLTLDIYAPPNAADLPVMVWIHGGGNTWGRSSAYNGSQLALDQDVIVIAIQYRLGPLGYFSHPALREFVDNPADRAANFAILDMVASLEWVRANAAAFGGNPENVTIFGESAGGHNVAALMASPRARGLFEAAIMQSALTWSTPLLDAEAGSETQRNGAIEIAEIIAGDVPDADDLRAVELQALFDAYTRTGAIDVPLMIEDGVTLGRGGIRAAAATPGGFADVPLITGANRDENRLYKALNPDLVNRVSLLLWPKDEASYLSIADYPSRFWRALAVDDLANSLHAAGHENVWAYRFDWDEGGSFLVTDTGLLFGAAHSMEIPFVFNHFEFYGALDQLLFTNGNEPGRAALAEAMGDHWGHFAHHGRPLESWQAWEPGGALMRFDTPEAGGPEMISGEESLASILDALEADAALSAVQRCSVAEELTAWNPVDADQIAARISC
ncbi:MAG: carboxylesterase family protein [Alphaproteobacteria bacterium]|nr:carboxylesterase family protein [Alphaproteobacteria bacterium]